MTIKSGDKVKFNQDKKDYEVFFHDSNVYFSQR